MALVDSDALILEQAIGFSLPDPTLVPGRTHELKNSAAAPVIVSSSGATPFSTGGVNTATITLAGGQAIRYQSDGVRWTAKSSGGRSFFAGSAVSDAAGNATFAFPAGLFASAPIAQAAIQAAASNQPIDYRITAISAAACTIHVRQSPVLVVLSLSVLGVSAPLAGVTVHLFATPSGATP